VSSNVKLQLDADRLAEFFWYLEKSPGGPIVEI